MITSIATEPDPPTDAVREVVERALREDLGPLGDLSASLVPSTKTTVLTIVSRTHGVVAGRSCAEMAFEMVDPTLAIDWFAPDGTTVTPGSKIARIRGGMRPMLSAERTALNFLTHLSGIATLTRRFVDAVTAVNPAVRVLDTRKTIPGLRAVEKAAVRAGGGTNHRGNLSDGVMIKDNHLVGLGISEAVRRALATWPGRLVEVECESEVQVEEAARAGATAVLLDNMSPEEAASAALVARKHSPAVLVEVSGGITLETAPAYASAGVDLISVGALTHSAPALDIGLDHDGEGT